MSKASETVKKIASELLEKMEIATSDLTVEEDEDGTIRVVIASEEDSGVLIGYHGENLNSLQKIISLIYQRQLGEWKQILVDAQGYREERRAKIEELAENAAKRVRFLQDATTLPPMNAFERRIVHLKVAEIPGVWTESIGEGRDRRVVIKPGEKQEEPETN